MLAVHRLLLCVRSLAVVVTSVRVCFVGLGRPGYSLLLQVLLKQPLPERGQGEARPMVP